jgi:hypothetical protein
MISIATDTVDAAELTKPKKYEIKEIVLIATLLGVVSTVFDFMFFAVFVNQGLIYCKPTGLRAES